MLNRCNGANDRAQASYRRAPIDPRRTVNTSR
jgi:uncharacterized protein with von Willebrand factor type A (vWA) domain